MLGGDWYYGCGDIPNFMDEGAFRQFREYLIAEGAYSFGFFSSIFPTLPFVIPSGYTTSRTTVVLRHLRLPPPPVGTFELVLSDRNRGRLNSQVTRGCREWFFPTMGIFVILLFLLSFLFLSVHLL
ncbi:hypothetical protein BKA83DRAFT_1811384 [Pisolithus microcarpus]|nr:hypothetical protein BKA83DRAFT_1811384 [Pisolithus microcarpus]